MHADNGHKFDRENVEIPDLVNPKNARKFQDAWDSDQSATNIHIELDLTYYPFEEDQSITWSEVNETKQLT